MNWPRIPLKGQIREISTRKGQTQAEILSVTNSDGFVRSLEVFDKQVFSEDASAYKLVQFDDLAYNPSRINVGSVARCDLPRGGAVSPMYVVIRCGDTLLPQFLLFFLKSKIGLQHVAHRCVGAVRPMLRFSDLEQIELPLPSIDEQRRIVKLLNDTETLKQLRRNASDATGKLVRSLYIKMFWRARNRKDWRIETINDLAEGREGSIRTGPFGSQLLHSEFVETGIPVLGIENVTTNEFRWTPPRCIPPSKFRQFERFRVFPGDVLVTIMGTVGRSCVAPEDLPTCISTKHLCVISLDRQKANPRFVWAALLFDPGVLHQTSGAGGGAVMEGWNSTIIRQLKFAVPPLEIQHEFAAYIDRIRELQTSQKRGLKRIDDLFDSIAHRAFGGHL